MSSRLAYGALQPQRVGEGPHAAGALEVLLHSRVLHDEPPEFFLWCSGLVQREATAVEHEPHAGTHGVGALNVVERNTLEPDAIKDMAQSPFVEPVGLFRVVSDLGSRC